MNVSAISSAVPAVVVPEVQKPAAALVTSKPSAPPAPIDTVTLSSAKVPDAQISDPDHDGK
jgi:hypothetical protein